MKGLTVLVPSCDGVGCVPQSSALSLRILARGVPSARRGVMAPSPLHNQWANPLLEAFPPLNTSCLTGVKKRQSHKFRELRLCSLAISIPSPGQ